MLVEPCEGELHARFSGGWEETRRQSATPRGAGRLPPTRQERNVTDLLPERDRPQVLAKIRGAWSLEDADLAQERLERIASELDRTWPDAAGSLREGLAETLR